LPTGDPDDEDSEERMQATLAEVTGFTFLTQNGTEITEDGMIVKVACGEAHTLVLSKNGHVYFYGSHSDISSHNFSYDESKEEYPHGFDALPVRLPLPKRATDIVSGCNFSWIKYEDGTWNSFGRFISMGSQP